MNEDEFRINQTKQRLLREGVQCENIHYEVCKKIRKAIADIGGMMPEEMLTSKESLKELERKRKQLEQKVLQYIR